MKKRYLSFILVSIFSCKSPKTTFNVQTGLNGKVKKVTENNTLITKTEGKEVEIDHFINKIKSERYYTEDGKLEKIESFYDGELSNTIKLRYNLNDLIKIQELFDSDGVLKKTEIRNSDTLVLAFSPLGDTISKSIEKLNFTGLSKIITKKYSDPIKEVDFIERNADGWITESYSIFIMNGDTLNKSKTYYKYPETDEKGNWTKSYASDIDSDTMRVISRIIEYFKEN